MRQVFLRDSFVGISRLLRIFAIGAEPICSPPNATAVPAAKAVMEHVQACIARPGARCRSAFSKLVQLQDRAGDPRSDPSTVRGEIAEWIESFM